MFVLKLCLLEYGGVKYKKSWSRNGIHPNELLDTHATFTFQNILLAQDWNKPTKSPVEIDVSKCGFSDNYS
jgi:hypothetical protein